MFLNKHFFFLYTNWCKLTFFSNYVNIKKKFFAFYAIVFFNTNLSTGGIAMDIEKMLINGMNVDTSCPYPSFLSVLTCKNLPIHEGQEEILAQEPKQNGETSIFYALKDNADAYLKEKFKMDLYDFIKIYTSRIIEGGVYFPISAPLFVCVFRKESDIKLLERQFRNHQALVISYPFSSQGTIPNLHDASIYILTLVECNFSLLTNIVVPSGMYHVGEEYRFLIKMSSQQDITILYEKK